ncbi:MAG TPA: signal peptide peptidase SppA [Candidatus Alistipes avicola]|uniref:Signal peptide peptidase SppA n=1 Tax=Candidatus Alistipes avicola TaxID=2838432 RepID=A0A9D2IEY1_9BACT|nr:signal peptide peptidase SppA [uncultured Alistipes sp.]HJA98742.1 signal peptide peptidase SppA [Candidatus Alistipes avicola]
MKFLKTFLASLLAFVVGGLVVFFLSMIILMGVIGSITSKEQVVIGNHAILKIDMAEDITDSPSTTPFGNIDLATMTVTYQISLMNALRAIETAKEDPRIQGIYLRMNGSGVTSLSILEELREALVDFRTSGKFVLAYNEVYGQSGYYLATAADGIYLEPNGSLQWTGIASTLMFYKGLFDKLDIQTEIFRPTACKYKSAVEPYFLNKMSEENRRQMQQIVDSYWSVVVDAVSSSRGIAPEELNRLADEWEVSLADEAREKGFVDGLIFEDEMDDIFRNYGAVPDVNGQFEFVTLGEYASMLTANMKNLSAPQVAVVYADGAIVDGEGYGKEIYGNSLASLLAEVRKDDQVKAVVLRVNSPGGSALASDVIWREMELLKAQKPVVVSMGSYAASGGYYISCGADVIVADKTTLTGSIGVFGMFMRMEEALKNKLGITFDAVRTNTSADAGVMRPLTARERAAIMRGVDKVYETFTSYVAEGRNLPLEKVLDIAQGRVWSGTAAVENGLVDANGGLKSAIAIAADKAGLGTNYRVVEKLEMPTGIETFFSGFFAKVKADIAAEELGPFAGQWQKIREVIRQQGIVMYCPYGAAMAE